MRTVQIIGAILVALGLWVLIRPPSYTHEQSVLKLGDVEARVQHERPVPGWAGGLALGAGAVLLVVGFKRR
jgi:hypothetical protein